MLRICAIAALAAAGCASSNKPQPTQITSAPAPATDQRVIAMQADITRLERERDEARRAADQERNRHVQYIRLQQERNDLEDRAWSRLAEVDAYLLKLEEKANKVTGGTRARIESEVVDAATKRQAIERELRRVHTETEQSFARLKRDLETRIDDLYGTVRAAAERK
jgi:hypothetical protein